MRRSHLRIWTGILSLSALSILSGCGAAAWKPADGPRPDAIVTMHFHSFDPKTVTINAGGTVRWENKTLIWHTVTADPKLADDAADVALPPGAEAFDLGKVEAGSAVQHTFTIPGTYRYFCKPHESSGMIGEVVVNPLSK